MTSCYIHIFNRKSALINMIRKNIFLYTIIIIIPTIIAVLLFRQYLEKQEQLEIQQNSLKLGELHQQYIQTLIKETVKSLDVLSIVALDFKHEKAEMKHLLLQTKDTDQRYGDLYLADAEGVILTGTRDQYNGVKSRSGYIQACAKTKKAQVSVVRENNYRKLLSVCNPIIKKDSDISGFLLVQLKLDYIENVLRLLTPQIAVKITDEKNKEIFTINNDLKSGPYQQILPFDDLPWMLHINHPNEQVNIDTNKLFQFSIILLIVTHIIFFAVQFMLIRKDTIKKEKIYEHQKLKMLGTLAATTAHEIKNPLTGIKGLVQLLSEKYDDNQDKMYFSVIQQEITRINEIVNDFLVLGKPNAHPLQIVDLTSVLQEIEPILQMEAASTSIKLSVENAAGKVPVLCLKDQIKQVILNISKNSFEACQPGHHVSIELLLEQETAVLTIIDNGIGMSKNTLKNVFEPFYTTKNYGTGLGLYICKKIIMNMDGHMSIRSKRHVGTTVTIVLPLVIAAKDKND